MANRFDVVGKKGMLLHPLHGHAVESRVWADGYQVE